MSISLLRRATSLPIGRVHQNQRLLCASATASASASASASAEDSAPERPDVVRLADNSIREFLLDRSFFHTKPQSPPFGNTFHVCPSFYQRVGEWVYQNWYREASG